MPSIGIVLWVFVMFSGPVILMTAVLYRQFVRNPKAMAINKRRDPLADTEQAEYLSLDHQKEKKTEICNQLGLYEADYL